MIKKYITKKGETRYLFQTYLGIDPATGKEKRTTRRGFKTIKEAKAAERDLLLDVEENGFSSNEDFQNPTFSEVAELWLDSYKSTVKPTTYQHVKEMLDVMIDLYFTDMKIQQISVAYCQKVAIKLSNRYILYTNYYSVINRIFKYATSLDIIKSNPLDKIIKPKNRPLKAKENHYTKQELTEFLTICKANCKPVEYTFFHLLAFSGLRSGEAIGLMWSDVDFENKRLSISRTAVVVNKKQTVQDPKTKRSKRVITLDDETLNVLKLWKRQQIKEYFQAGKAYQHDSNYIFTNNRGAWLLTSTMKVKLKRFLCKHNELKKITPHGFRHTHASLLFEAGLTAKIISDRLGHNNVQTTLDMYTHINDNQRVEVVEQLMDFIRSS
ncbi:tyrosine-type recombinase/integrase [Streptococcus mitis]|uniref:tyrosine-type recombinase/integrase n=1 Tax=Streptococcus mitis TaxID=28037 RepID=UPI001C1E9984|nr:site-specific integrase [Streptococcus mitis]MBU6825002.1 site-specific integrase [Streptococcus mitis]